ncbi:MAG: B12-binding domain-containing protein, partial [Sporomusa sp.]
MDLSQLSLYVQKGSAAKVKEAVSEALAQNVAPTEILNAGLIDAMAAVGEKFK